MNHARQPLWAVGPASWGKKCQRLEGKHQLGHIVNQEIRMEIFSGTAFSVKTHFPSRHQTKLSSSSLLTTNQSNTSNKDKWEPPSDCKSIPQLWHARNTVTTWWSIRYPLGPVLCTIRSFIPLRVQSSKARAVYKYALAILEISEAR